MMTFRNLLILFIAIPLATSCAALSDGDSDRLSKDQAELVSRDFVTAMSKLRGFSDRG